MGFHVDDLKRIGGKDGYDNDYFRNGKLIATTYTTPSCLNPISAVFMDYLAPCTNPYFCH